MKRYPSLGIIALLISLTLAGCSEPDQGAVTITAQPAGDAAAGQIALAEYGCGSCHHIPGVVGATAYVGPPLDAWAARSYIAGSLPNEPVYLREWIRFPQAIEPGTAMPNLEVTEDDAADMAAYLYTLRGDQTWYIVAMDFLGLSE